jgi:starch synthase (maltosyl-transferring)
MASTSRGPDTGGSKRSAQARPAAVKLPAERPSRVVIEDALPLLDGGRHRAKRCVGDRVEVSADVFADGHEVLRAVVHYRRRGEPRWRSAALRPVDAGVGGDRWTGAFEVDELGRWQWQLEALIDRYASWSEELARKLAVGETELDSELAEGAALLGAAAARA